MYQKQYNEISIICLHKSKGSNSSILQKFSLAWVNKVKWFQIRLCIPNNLIKRLSTVYTELNNQTALFIKFQFYLTHRLDPFRCYHSGSEWTWERSKAPALLKPHNQIVNVLYRILVWRDVLLSRDGDSIFYILRRLGLVNTTASPKWCKILVRTSVWRVNIK